MVLLLEKIFFWVGNQKNGIILWEKCFLIQKSYFHDWELVLMLRKSNSELSIAQQQLVEIAKAVVMKLWL